MFPEDMIDQILGHYKILRPLGIGGMATVFLALDIRLQREIALKVFRPKEGETHEFLRRFEREARVLAQLDHPNILPVYDYGEQDGLAYLVMPYMAGGSLRERLYGRGPISTKEAIQQINQALNALQYAHDRGLVHRDVKPGNMLFKGDSTLLLSDFGLVKILHDQGDLSLMEDTATISGTHSISGTPDYMAPEQIMGQAIPTSDIYAMGIVLYQMLTGKRPFTSTTHVGMLMKHLHDQPEPLRSHNPLVPPALEAVVLRAIEKDPLKRYQRPSELKQALELSLRVTPAETIQAYEDSIIDSSGPTSEVQTVVIPDPTESPEEALPDTHTEEGAQKSEEAPATKQPAQAVATVAPPEPERQTTPSPRSSSDSGNLPGQSLATIKLEQKRSHTPRHITFLVVILVLVLGLGGVFYTINAANNSKTTTPTPLPTTPSPPPTKTVNTVTPTQPPVTPQPTTATMPPTKTSCPAENTARAAVIAPLKLGKNQNIIYLFHEGPAEKPTAGLVKRYDIATGEKAEIVRIPSAQIAGAQVSQDGQWILFTLQTASRTELHLVRVDGLGHQTLYCSPQNTIVMNVQWSFNQERAVFAQGDPNAFPFQPGIYLLDFTNGKLQSLLVPQGKFGYLPVTWLDDDRVYLTSFLPSSDTPQTGLFVLDLLKGPDQRESNLQTVIKDQLLCHSFDPGYNSELLYMSICKNGPATAPGGSIAQPPTTITTRPPTGGKTTLVTRLEDMAVIELRIVGQTTMLLFVKNSNPQLQFKNGLWKMNIDGTNLVQISSDQHNEQRLNHLSQYAWSSVSLDEKHFALEAENQNNYGMYYGSMAGGKASEPPPALQRFSDGGAHLLLVGWTAL